LLFHSFIDQNKHATTTTAASKLNYKDINTEQNKKDTLTDFMKKTKKR